MGQMLSNLGTKDNPLSWKTPLANKPSFLKPKRMKQTVVSEQGEPEYSERQKMISSWDMRTENMVNSYWLSCTLCMCHTGLVWKWLYLLGQHYRNAPIEKHWLWKRKWVENDVERLSIKKPPVYVPLLVIVLAQTLTTLRYSLKRNSTPHD